MQTPQYLPVEAPTSAATAHIMAKMWKEYIEYTRRKVIGTLNLDPDANAKYARLPAMHVVGRHSVQLPMLGAGRSASSRC
jgi:hypothetical protein